MHYKPVLEDVTIDIPGLIKIILDVVVRPKLYRFYQQLDVKPASKNVSLCYTISFVLSNVFLLPCIYKLIIKAKWLDFY